MNLKRIILLITLIGGFALAQDSSDLSEAAVSSESSVSIESGVDKSRITIGDLITYTVTVTHDKDVRVEMPGLGANLGGFEIRDYELLEPEKKKGQRVSRVEYVISTFFTGEFEIPPLPILYWLPGDSTAQIMRTESIPITVESVKASEAAELRDIKQPLEIPAHWWFWGRWVALGLIVVTLATAAWFIYRRKKAGQGIFTPREAPKRPPHEVALEALEALRRENLLEQGEIKRFYIEASDIIRRYFEGRFYIQAMEMTTGEVMTGLRRADMDTELLDQVRTVLEESDLVKFAKMIPPRENSERILPAAYHIVESTMVVMEEPVEVEAEPVEETPAIEAEEVKALPEMAEEKPSGSEEPGQTIEKES